MLTTLAEFDGENSVNKTVTFGHRGFGLPATNATPGMIRRGKGKQTIVKKSKKQQTQAPVLSQGISFSSVARKYSDADQLNEQRTQLRKLAHEGQKRQSSQISAKRRPSQNQGTPQATNLRLFVSKTQKRIETVSSTANQSLRVEALPVAGLPAKHKASINLLAQATNGN